MPIIESDDPPPRTLRLENRLAELPRLDEWVDQMAVSLGLADRIGHDLRLALEEVVTNVITHAYRDDAPHEIVVRATPRPDGVAIEVEDDGIAFDPLGYPPPDTTGSLHRHRGLDRGEVATYIPELGKANPDHFGLAIVSVDGRVWEVGDSRQEFTIQSISKPFVFGMALEEHGRAATLARVGVEPTGEAFNAIVLDEATNRPFNPMVNAGAIATTALVTGASPEERRAKLLAKFSAAAGRPLSVDESVFASERATGNRNRAIAYLMLNFGMIPEHVGEVLDLYFQQCSILVSCRDLAVMAATLANVGVNPVTGEDAFEMQYVKDMLAVMFTCGMYDFSGEWAYGVGVPAKSGVAGGVMAVVNRQLGIATYSPRLDARGNSCRGIEACVDIADELGLHVFDLMNLGSQFMQTLVRTPNA